MSGEAEVYDNFGDSDDLRSEASSQSSRSVTRRLPTFSEIEEAWHKRPTWRDTSVLLDRSPTDEEEDWEEVFLATAGNVDLSRAKHTLAWHRERLAEWMGQLQDVLRNSDIKTVMGDIACVLFGSSDSNMLGDYRDHTISQLQKASTDINVFRTQMEDMLFTKYTYVGVGAKAVYSEAATMAKDLFRHLTMFVETLRNVCGGVALLQQPVSSFDVADARVDSDQQSMNEIYMRVVNTLRRFMLDNQLAYYMSDHPCIMTNEWLALEYDESTGYVHDRYDDTRAWSDEETKELRFKQYNTRVMTPLKKADVSSGVVLRDFIVGLAHESARTTYNPCTVLDPHADFMTNLSPVKLRHELYLTSVARKSLCSWTHNQEKKPSSKEADQICKPVGSMVLATAVEAIQASRALLPSYTPRFRMEARSFSDGILVIYRASDKDRICPQYYPYREGPGCNSSGVQSKNQVRESETGRSVHSGWLDLWNLDNGNTHRRYKGLDSCQTPEEVYRTFTECPELACFRRFYQAQKFNPELQLYHIEWVFMMLNMAQFTTVRALTFFEGASGAGKTAFMSAVLSWVNHCMQFPLPCDNNFPLSEFAHPNREYDQAFYCADAQSKDDRMRAGVPANLLYQLIDRSGCVPVVVRNVGTVKVEPRANMFVSCNGSMPVFKDGGAPDALWRRTTPFRFSESVIDNPMVRPNDARDMQRYSGFFGLIGLRLAQLRCRDKDRHWFNASNPQEIEPEQVARLRERYLFDSNPLAQVLLDGDIFERGPAADEYDKETNDLVQKAYSVSKLELLEKAEDLRPKKICPDHLSGIVKMMGLKITHKAVFGIRLKPEATDSVDALEGLLNDFWTKVGTDASILLTAHRHERAGPFDTATLHNISDAFQDYHDKQSGNTAKLCRYLSVHECMACTSFPSAHLAKFEATHVLPGFRWRSAAQAKIEAQWADAVERSTQYGEALDPTPAQIQPAGYPHIDCTVDDRSRILAVLGTESSSAERADAMDEGSAPPACVLCQANYQPAVGTYDGMNLCRACLAEKQG